MIKRTVVYFMLTLAIWGGLCSKSRGQNVTVQRERTYLRAGAGSYYDIMATVPVKTRLAVLATDGSWYKVKYQNKQGYISATATQAKAPRNDVFSQMGGKNTDTTVGRYGMSAGVKGFGERFSKAFKGDPEFLVAAEQYRLRAADFAQFKNDTYKGINVKKLRQRYPLPARPQPDYFTEAEEGFGLGVASAIANLGLYDDPQLQEYVNSVGQLVVDGSDLNDVTYKFFVLDVAQPNAYACPGGYAFITVGMLRSLTNEAELACVLAHEIAHVSRFHGLKEMKQRVNQMAAEDAFAELDEDTADTTDEQTKLTEKELEDDAFDMYETIIQGRLDAYEREADALGMLFAVRAGYNPSALRDALARLVAMKAQSNNDHYRPDSMKQRLGWIDSELRKDGYPTNLNTLQNRYKRYTSGL